MKEFVSGTLEGISETKVTLRIGNQSVSYPRKELAISIEWVMKNMGKRVTCVLENGTVESISGTA